MNDVIRQLFEITERQETFEKADTTFSSECEKRFNPYMETT